jgi:hypothetical protein
MQKGAKHSEFPIITSRFRVPLVACPTVVPGLSHALSGTGKLLKRGRLAPCSFARPAFFIEKNWPEIFTPFSALFQAVVKNVTHRISILTAVLDQFFTIF